MAKRQVRKDDSDIKPAAVKAAQEGSPAVENPGEVDESVESEQEDEGVAPVGDESNPAEGGKGDGQKPSPTGMALEQANRVFVGVSLDTPEDNVAKADECIRMLLLAARNLRDAQILAGNPSGNSVFIAPVLAAINAFDLLTAPCPQCAGKGQLPPPPENPRALSQNMKPETCGYCQGDGRGFPARLYTQADDAGTV